MFDLKSMKFTLTHFTASAHRETDIHSVCSNTKLTSYVGVSEYNGNPEPSIKSRKAKEKDYSYNN